MSEDDKYVLIFFLVVILVVMVGIILCGLKNKIYMNKIYMNYPNLIKVIDEYIKQRNEKAEFYFTHIRALEKCVDEELLRQKYLLDDDLIISNKRIDEMKMMLKENNLKYYELCNKFTSITKELNVWLNRNKKVKNFVVDYFGIDKGDIYE